MSRGGIATVAGYAASQGVAQLLGFLAGVLVIRSLPLEDYAQYVVATTVMAAVVMVTDSGTTSALLTAGAERLNDERRLALLFNTALHFRRRLAIAVGLCGAAVMAPLLLMNGADPAVAILSIALTLAAVWPALTRGVLVNCLRLVADARSMQLVSVWSSALRIALITVGVAVGTLTGAPGLLFFLAVAVAAAAFEDLYVRRKVRRVMPSMRGIGTDGGDRAALKSNLRLTMPMTLVVVAQTQVLNILLSALGSPESLASIAALSRFALVFVILNNIVADLGAGKVAHLPPQRAPIRAVFFRVLGLYLAASTVLVLLAGLAAPLLLWVLGGDYAGLEGPLVIVAAGAALINFGNAFRALNHARGWIDASWLYIPVMLAWAAFGAFLLNLADPVEASIFMATQSVCGLVTQAACYTRGYRALGRS